jgi:hypothetical protein
MRVNLMLLLLLEMLFASVKEETLLWNGGYQASCAPWGGSAVEIVLIKSENRLILTVYESIDSLSGKTVLLDGKIQSRTGSMSFCQEILELLCETKEIGIRFDEFSAGRTVTGTIAWNGHGPPELFQAEYLTKVELSV